MDGPHDKQISKIGPNDKHISEICKMGGPKDKQYVRWVVSHIVNYPI